MVLTFPLYLALDTRHMEDPNDSKNTVLKEHLNTTSSLPLKILDKICAMMFLGIPSKPGEGAQHEATPFLACVCPQVAW